MEPFDDEVKVTSQEQRILELMAAGKTCNQMAEDMGLTVQTIKWYRMRLCAKFQALLWWFFLWRIYKGR